MLYGNIKKELDSKVFFVNPYDPYIANLTINRINIKIFWRVNDLNISPVDSEKVKI